MYSARTLEKFLLEASQQFPVVLVTGPRQVGKTTFMQHNCASDRTYVTLDDPLIRSLATTDPALFLQRFPPPVLIDEVQYAPELFPLIKVMVDREQRPGMFWLTGSQQFSLMKNVTESLAGRVALLRLLGLSQRELYGQAELEWPFLPTQQQLQQAYATAHPLNVNELYYNIWRGSYPRIALNDALNSELFYSSYVQTYLQRDVRDLTQVGDERAFLRFLRAAAARTAQMLNMTELARDADISPNTAKHWLSILQSSCIVHLLEPYHNHLIKRFVKTPKLYFLDTGLCAYLTGWSSPQTLEIGAMSGAMLETYVITQVLKSYWHNGRTAPLFFYRDQDGREIDLFIVQDNLAYPVEIKKTASPKKDDLKHFSAVNKIQTAAGGILCLVDKPIPLTAEWEAIPIACL